MSSPQSSVLGLNPLSLCILFLPLAVLAAPEETTYVGLDFRSQFAAPTNQQISPSMWMSHAYLLSWAHLGPLFSSCSPFSPPFSLDDITQTANLEVILHFFLLLTSHLKFSLIIHSSIHSAVIHCCSFLVTLLSLHRQCLSSYVWPVLSVLELASCFFPLWPSPSHESHSYQSDLPCHSPAMSLTNLGMGDQDCC